MACRELWRPTIALSLFWFLWAILGRMPTCGEWLLANKAELLAHTASDLRLPSCLSTVRPKVGLGKLALGAVLRVGGTGTTAIATIV